MTLMLSLFALQDDVVAARPDIDVRVEQLVSRGIWMPPGYKVGTLFPLIIVPSRTLFANAIEWANECRKNSEIFRFFKWERNRSVHTSCRITILYFSRFKDEFPISILHAKPKSTDAVTTALRS